MSERFKEHAWNACVGQLTESSNLSLPAINLTKFILLPQYKKKFKGSK